MGVSCTTGYFIVSVPVGLRLVLEEVTVSTNLEVLDSSLVSHKNTILVSLEPSDWASMIYTTLNTLLNSVCLLSAKSKNHYLF